MHRTACQLRLPHQQLVNKGHHHKAAAETKSTVVMPVVKPASAIIIRSFKEVSRLKMRQ